MTPFKMVRWLRSLLHTRVRTYEKRPRRRLLLETLEDRLAPATHTWTGAADGINWSNPGNWQEGTAPAGTAAAHDDLVFGSQGGTFLSPKNDLPATNNVIDSITFSSSNYNLTGNAIQLGDPSVTGSGTITVGSFAANNSIQFNMTLAGTTATGSVQFFIVNDSADLTISGVISGNSSLTKQGKGLLVLSGNNATFTGNITLDNNGGITRITNANALGDTTGITRVGSVSQLQVSNVAGNINEFLVLNGAGTSSSDGALLNLAGNNTWAGNIELDSDSTIGSAVAGSALTIQGAIVDLTPLNITKEGPGEVKFTHVGGNSYRGTTTINDGILTITDPLSLGLGDQTPASGTIVNRTVSKAGTLQLAILSGTGFTVLNEILTLNGAGAGGIGALNNLSGNNVWAYNIVLGSPNPNNGGITIPIAVQAGSQLLVSGKVIDSQDLSPPPANTAILPLNKIGTGTLIFDNNNSYRGATTVSAGTLVIRDSGALGATAGATSVTAGATLQLEVDSGFDAHGRDLSVDSVTGVSNRLRISEPLTINGQGVAVAGVNVGGLRSASGINTIISTVNMNSTSSIGVDPDPSPESNNNYFTDDYSLTIGDPTAGLGVVNGGAWNKLLTGQLILPRANGFTGRLTIMAGWVTIQNDQALGPFVVGTTETLQADTVVNAGAALHLKPLPGGPDLNVVENLTLAGLGITHPFGLISQKGALMSLGGNNTVGSRLQGAVTVGSDIFLGQGAANIAGIGVEILNPATTSELLITGSMFDNVSSRSQPAAPAVTGGGGFTKLGSRRLILQADGTYSGAVDVAEGTLRIQNDTALGSVPGSVGTVTNTTVEDNAVLEIKGTTLNPYPNDGGSAAGISVFNERLTLTGNGPSLNQIVTIGGASGTFKLTFQGQTTGPLDITSPTLGNDIQNALNALNTIGAPIGGVGGSVNVSPSGLASSYTVTFGGSLAQAIPPRMGVTALTGTATATVAGSGNASVINLSDDNMWRGPGTWKTNTTIDVRNGSRLTLFGAIDDGAPSGPPQGSGLTKIGNGELVLGGSNTYRGTTNITQGVVTLENSQALGTNGIGESQQIVLSGATAGTTKFAVSFNGSALTPDVPYTGTAADAVLLQGFLNNLSTIAGLGTVNVSGSGGTFTVTFGGGLSGFDQPLLQAQITNAPGSVVVNPVTDGAGGTIVASGAQLQVQGSLTVAGEPLILSGNGNSGVPNAATLDAQAQWTPVGPNGITNGETQGRMGVAGRVTGIAADPGDSNTVYIVTAGGGAFKTKDGGITWHALIDNVNGVPVSVNQILFSGAIAVSPTDPRVLYVGLGEDNHNQSSPAGVGTPGGLVGLSQYGRGILKSTDSGRTWTLIQGKPVAQGGTGVEFDRKAVSKIVVDPSIPSLVWAAVTGSTAAGELLQNGLPAANSAIYRIDTSTAVPTVTDMTTGKVPIDEQPTDGLITFSGTYDYTDLSVVVDPSNPNTGRVMAVAIGNPNGSAYDPTTPGVNSTPNAVYVSLDTSTNNATTTQTFNLFKFPTGDPIPGSNPLRNFTHAGIIKLAMVVSPRVTGINSAPFPLRNDVIAITVYAMFSYPSNWNTGQMGFGAPNTFYEMQRLQFWYQYQPNNFPTTPLPTRQDLAPFLIPISPWAPIQTATSLTPTPVVGALQPPANYMGTEGYYDQAILVRTPAAGNLNPTNIYISGLGQPTSTGPYVTQDGGISWTNGVTGQDIGLPDGNNNDPHLEYHAMDFDASGRLLFGTDGGIWRREIGTNGPVGGLWTDLSGNLADTQLMSVAVNPNNASIIYGGSQDNGTERFNGSTLTWLHLGGTAAAQAGENGDGGLVRIDPKNPNTIYHIIGFNASNSAMLRKSTDGGVTWVNLYPNGANNTVQHFVPFVIDPLNTQRLLVSGNSNPVANNGRLTESLNGGTTWVNLADGLAGAVTGIAIAGYQGSFQNDARFLLVTDKGANNPDPDTIYVTDGTNIRLTKNHGVSWTANLTIPAGAGSITDIMVDPTNRDTVYYVRNGFDGANPMRKIFKSTDAGVTWSNITSNLPDIPVWKIVLDPRDGDLYLGTDNGVYYSTNNGTTWNRFGAGLPNAQVRDIDLNTNLNVITVATYGRGAFQMFLDRVPASGGALRAVSGTSQWTGPITLAGDTTIAADGPAAFTNQVATASIDIGGTIGGNFNLTKDGLGIITLSGANTYTGITTVQSGVLVVHNPKALGAAGPTSYTQVNPGTALQLQSDLEAETVKISGNGADTLNGHNTGALRNVSNNNTFTGTLILQSNSVIGVDSATTLTIGPKAGLVGTGTIDDGASAFNLVKELTGTLILASANTYDGITDIKQGALNIQNGQALGSGGAGSNKTTVENGAQLQTQGGITVLNEQLELFGTGVFSTGALLNLYGANRWQGIVSLLGPADINIGVQYPGDANMLSIDGVIGPNGTGFGINKVGDGTLALTNTNTYGGATTVSQGSIRVQNNGALGTNLVGTVVKTGAALQMAKDTGGNPIAVAAEPLMLNGPGTPEVQQVAVSGATGSFTLSFNNSLPSSSLGFAASAGQVQAALFALSTVSGVGGTVNVSSQTVGGVTYYTVIFGGSLAGGNLPLIQAVGISGVTATTSTVDDGGRGALRNIVGNNSWSGPVVLQTNTLMGADVDLLTVSGDVQDPTEIQTIDMSGTTGNFQVSYNGSTTPSRPVGEAGSQLQTDLNALASIQGGTSPVFPSPLGAVSVTKAGTVFTIKFDTGALAFTNAAQVTAVSTTGSPIITTVVDGTPVPAASLTKVGNGVIDFPTTNDYSGKTLVNEGILRIGNSSALGTVFGEVQTLTLSGAVGTFTMSFNGSPVTPSINVASGTLRADIENALNNLSTIGGLTPVAGSVKVFQVGTTFTIVFGGSLANQNLVPLQAFGSGGANAVIGTTRDGPEGTLVNSGGTLQLDTLGSPVTTEALTINGPGYNNAGALQNYLGNNTWAGTILLGSNSAIGVGSLDTQQVLAPAGAFSLSFGAAPAINFASTPTAAQMQAALNGLTTIGGVGGSVAVTVDPNNPLLFTVTFGGFFATQAAVANLGGSATVTKIAAVGGSNNTLVINQPITDGGSAFSVTKVGPGTLQYAGGAGTSNTYTGVTNVNDGKLSLNKTGGAVAIQSNVVIGDALPTAEVENVTVPAGAFSLTFNGATANFGAAPTGNQMQIALNNLTSIKDIGGSVAVQLSAGVYQVTFGGTLAGVDVQLTGSAGVNIVTVTNGAQPFNPTPGVVQWLQDDQIANSAKVTVNPDGQLDLNGHLETINQFAMKDGMGTTGSTGTGILTVNSSADFTGSSLFTIVNSSSQLVLNGPLTAISDGVGTPQIKGLSVPSGTVALGAGGGLFTVNKGLKDVDMDVEAVITGGAGAGITKAGAGRLQLGSANTYPGATTINAGDVQVDGSVGAVIVNAATASVSGLGTIGTVTGTSSPGTPVVGTINPGDNGGTPVTGPLNSQDVTMGAGTTFYVDLNGPDTTLITVPGTNHDWLNVAGNVDLAGATLAGKVGNVALFDQFTIIKTTGVITNQFAQGTTAYLDGKKFQVTYNAQSVVLKLVKSDVTMNVTQSIAAPVYGQLFSFTVTVTPESGSGTVPASDTVTFDFDATSAGMGHKTKTIALSGNQASFDPQAENSISLPVGTYALTVSFSGDVNFFNANMTTMNPAPTIAVNPTTIVITSNPTNSPGPVYFQPTTVTATVTPSIAPTNPLAQFPTGTVTFTVDSNPQAPPAGLNGAGQAQITLNNLNVNTHHIAATYNTDGFYGSSNTISDYLLPVRKDDTFVSVAPLPASPSTYGQSVTFTATVLPAVGLGQPTGTVRFYDGTPIPVNQIGSAANVNPANGQASISTTTLVAGSHTITAVYSGDSNYTLGNTAGNGTPNNGLGTASFNVNLATVAIGVSANQPSTVFGQSVTFTATVTGVAPGGGFPTSGTVGFWDGPAGTGTFLGNGNINPATGQAQATTTTLSGGAHTITARYNGNANYNASTAANDGTLSYTVNPAGVQIVVNPSVASPVVGQLVNFTAVLTAVPPGAGTPNAGFVQFWDGPANTGTMLGGQILVNAGSATVNGVFLSTAGSHLITAQYLGSSNFAANTGSLTNYNVGKANTNVTNVTANPPGGIVYGQSVTITATIASVAPGGGTPNAGTVTFYDGSLANQIDTPQPVSAGSASLTTTSIVVGASHTIIAVYNGSADYNGSQNNTSLTNYPVSKASSQVQSVNVNPGTSVFSQQLTITATLVAVPPGGNTPNGGNVTFFYDGSNQIGIPQSVSGGVAFIQTATIPVGTHTITAQYSGDGNYFGSSGLSSSFTVNMADTTTSLGTGGTPNPSAVGGTVTFTATVLVQNPGTLDPTSGTVLFYDGSLANQIGSATVQANHQAVANVSTLTFGVHNNIFAVYQGNGSYNASAQSAAVSQTVLKNDTITITPSVSPQNPKFGQTVDYAVTLQSSPTGQGVPTGTVTLSVDNVQFGSAQNLVVGATTSTFTFTGVPLGAVGPHTIKVDYSGDPSFAPNSNSIGQTVDKSDTNVAINPSDPTPVSGESVFFTALVTAASPGVGTVNSGTVTFYFDVLGNAANQIGSAINVSAGSAQSANISTLTVGAHTIYAVYSGNTSFNGKTSQISYTVNPANTTVNVIATSPAGTPLFGQSVTFQATVTANSPGSGTVNVGTVAFFDGANQIGTTQNISATGTASVSTSSLLVGPHDISAVYTPPANANFAGNTGHLNPYNVNKATPNVVVNANPTGVFENNPVTFTASMQAQSPGVGLPQTGTVDFWFDVNDGVGGSHYIGQGAVSGGQGQVTTSTLVAGTHTIIAVYNGNTSFNANTGSLANFQVFQNVHIGDQTISHTQTPFVHNLPQNGTYSIREAGTMAWFISHDYVLFPTGSFSQNYGGTNEKWIKGQVLNQYGTPWYFIRPDGSFYAWDGTPHTASGGTGPGNSNPLAKLDPIYWWYPDMLFDASQEYLAYAIDKRLGLNLSGTDSFDFAHLSERWVLGTGGWFFITPDGGFYDASTTTYTRLTTLDPIYYSQLDRLYNAQPARIAVDQSALSANPKQLKINTVADFVGQWVVELNTFNVGTSQIQERFTLTVQNKVPTIVQVGPQQMSTTTNFINVGINASDADPGDSVFLNAMAGHKGYIFGNLYNISSVDPTAYFSANEKWLRGNYDQFGKPWYLILPSGKVYAWNGAATAAGTLIDSGPNATLVDTLDPLYYYRPDLLINTRTGVGNGSAGNGNDLAFALHLHSDNGNFYLNTRGHQELWLLDAAGSWYYITPQGDLFNINDTFLTSFDHNGSLSGQTHSKYYDNNALLLTNAAAGQVTATMNGTQVKIDPANGFIGDFYVLIEASDSATFTRRRSTMYFKTTVTS